ncbi:hypothetical protein F4778DRAFT_784895 [Xylariomycetidae sp. FL2044]|nr:hypothetical protein F4778DRAFT_784895 [Xylariomycetidae sp. FL2044]
MAAFTVLSFLLAALKTEARSVPNQDVPPAAGFTGIPLPAVINAPLDCGVDTLLGSHFHRGLNVEYCAGFCRTTDGCTSFNTWLLYKNNALLGEQCALYTVTWDPKYATNTGQLGPDGALYQVGGSHLYTINSTAAKYP